MSNSYNLFTVILILICQNTFGQEDLFHEISFKKILKGNEEWKFEGEANWKHIYDNIGWRRLGTSIGTMRRIRSFNLTSGVFGYFTFNKEVENFFEVRP